MLHRDCLVSSCWPALNWLLIEHLIAGLYRACIEQVEDVVEEEEDGVTQSARLTLDAEASLSEHQVRSLSALTVPNCQHSSPSCSAPLVQAVKSTAIALQPCFMSMLHPSEIQFVSFVYGS